MLFFTQEELDNINEKKETSVEYVLHWWFRGIFQKEHFEEYGYKDVIAEIDYSPPRKFHEGGKFYKKGENNWNALFLENQKTKMKN